MFTLKEFYQPDTLEEAYRILQANRNNRMLGGCAFLRLGKKSIRCGIDPVKLDLNHIIVDGKTAHIGAAVNYGKLEDDTFFASYADGILHHAVSSIVSRQLRNTVLVGPSVYMGYGFSDFIPPLIALNAEVTLHAGGRMTLEAFRNRPRGPKTRDILTHVHIPLYSDAHGYYNAFRETSGDFPLLNLALTVLDGRHHVVFGARPQGAFRARKTESWLDSSVHETKETRIRTALRLMHEEVPFGENLRASRRYRNALAIGMLKEGLEELLS